MRKVRAAAAAASVVGMLAFAAGAQATGFTSSTVTTPSDGSLLVQNRVTNPNQTFTVSGTTNGNASEPFDIACYDGSTKWATYSGPGGVGIAPSADGSFTVTDVPQSTFAGGPNSGICHLVAVPHGSTPSLGTSFSGPRVGFSEFTTSTISGGPNNGAAWDYYFDDATPTGSGQSNSIDSCGPYALPDDGTSTSNLGTYLFDCAGSFFNSDEFDGSTPDLTRSEIQIDGQNAYGSASAEALVNNSDTFAGFPALSASLDSFNPSNGNAQTTESEPLVKCTPTDLYNPSSSDCTAFASTGVSIKRVTSYTNGGRVETVTDTFSSADGAAHSLDLQYEDDLDSATAGWEFPGQNSFSQHSAGPGPAVGTSPATIYVIDDASTAPSLSNPVGAITFSTAYKSVEFDSTLWSGETSALFDEQATVPAAGSVSIGWSYATGTSLAEVQAYAAAAPDVLQPPAVTISSPTTGTNLLSQPVKVTGTASAGSGVKSVTVNGVAATVGGGNWTASVPLTKGTNTLTATVTSDAGNSTTTSETVAYVPLAALIRKSERFTGKAVLVKVACSATGSNCNGILKLTFSETVVKHRKRHTITVGSVTKHQTLAAGKTATISVALNAKERRALKSAGKLHVTGIVLVTEASGVRAATAHASFTLTIKQPVKKRHK